MTNPDPERSSSAVAREIDVPEKIVSEGIRRVLKAGAPGLSEVTREGLATTMMRFVRPALTKAREDAATTMRERAAGVCDGYNFFGPVREVRARIAHLPLQGGEGSGAGAGAADG